MNTGLPSSTTWDILIVIGAVMLLGGLGLAWRQGMFRRPPRH